MCTRVCPLRSAGYSSLSYSQMLHLRHHHYLFSLFASSPPRKTHLWFALCIYQALMDSLRAAKILLIDRSFCSQATHVINGYWFVTGSSSANTTLLFSLVLSTHRKFVTGICINSMVDQFYTNQLFSQHLPRVLWRQKAGKSILNGSGVYYGFSSALIGSHYLPPLID